MTDTTITMAPSAIWASGVQTVNASGTGVFTSADLGRGLALYQPAPQRAAGTAYSVGAVFYSEYNTVDRLYRVVGAGNTASASMSGTVPNFDLNAPRDVGLNIIDGTATLRYVGAGKHVWGFGVITSINSTASVQVNVDPRGPFVSLSPTLRWKVGEWAPAYGFPRCMTFHAGRSWWAGSTQKPQTVWSSALGDYEVMRAVEDDGAVLDTSAITETLDDDQVNTVRWMLSMDRGLIIGAESGEFIVAPANLNGALSPSNLRAKRVGDRGSDPHVAATRVSGVVLFLQRGARMLRELQYDFATDSYQTTDLTQLADHISSTGFVEADYAHTPEGVWYGVRADGLLASLTYDREQKVRAWCRQQLGGTDVVIESIAIVQSPDGTSDDIYLSVSRTINGGTSRTIEYLRRPYRADLDGAAGGFFVDCGLTYTGIPAVTFSGLDHLEGETVWICADGSARNNAVVTGGSVTLTGPAASMVHIGLGYVARVTPMPVQAGAAQGSAVGQMSRFNRLTAMFLETGGAAIGRAGSVFDPLILRTGFDALSTAVPLFTGSRRLDFPDGWDREHQLSIESHVSLPMTLLAIVTDLETSG